MILSISSDLETFKGMSFDAGLNIVVADRTAASTDGQTRNSAGKTSIVEVIHFLIGADVGKGSPFQSEELEPYAFQARLRLGSDEVTVSRRGATPNQILLAPRDADALGVELATDKKTGEERRFTANFLWMCQGYYRHAEGYTPEWPDMDKYKGKIVHPQTWPQDLDMKGKKVVVIGSGATAATLVPAIAGDCEHVTLLQRPRMAPKETVLRHWPPAARASPRATLATLFRGNRHAWLDP